LPNLFPAVDPNGLLEYSVVYTDRALNHMSQNFQVVMRDVSSILKEVYNAKSALVVPGSGTYGMEAVARQFASGKNVMVLRNGWFSYRWTQIFEMGSIPTKETVLKARRQGADNQSPFAPMPIEEVVAAILREKPEVFFAPHVETSSGMILPTAYMRAVADAVHSVGGIFVLDCIASGTIWVDMVACGVDVVISAPQKGWSGSPCCALIAMSELARTRIDSTTSTSYACDLKSGSASLKRMRAAATPTTPPCRLMLCAACATRCWKPKLMVLPRSKPNNNNSAITYAPCSKAVASKALQRLALKRRAWWFATPKTPVFSPAKSF
jgi:aspartate aminotransferase-like enzyme